MKAYCVIKGTYTRFKDICYSEEVLGIYSSFLKAAHFASKYIKDRHDETLMYIFEQYEGEDAQLACEDEDATWTFPTENETYHDKFWYNRDQYNKHCIIIKDFKMD